MTARTGARRGIDFYKLTTKRAAQQLKDSGMSTAEEKCKGQKESANQATYGSDQTFPCST